MQTKRKSLIGLLALVALIVAGIQASVYGGIRLDGTEFQNASDVGGSISKDGSASESKIVYTLGQAVMVKGELPAGVGETAVKIGLGYEYNVAHTTDFGCSCPNQGDADKDGQSTTIDLAEIIDAIFAGGSNPKDALCPTFRYDANCDGFVDVLDLAWAVTYLFEGGPEFCQPCSL